MILIISLILAAVFIFLCGKALRACPAPFYAAAAGISALVTLLYWLAPAFVSLSLRAKLPIVLGAFGTACFMYVMYAGALPNGHTLMKRIMPIRGELSIVACLLTLGHNLSYGKNYLTPGYLFSGPVSTTKIAAWISVVLIVLMLILTITSIKAVRKRFPPKKWKALQRWAYLFYSLVYIHVLLLTIPNLLRGRTSYLVNLLVYSAVYLSYAVCRIQKAVLIRRGRAAKETGRRQAAGALAGVLLSVVLAGAVMLPSMAEDETQTADVPIAAPTEEISQPEEPSPAPEAAAEPTPEPAIDTEPDTTDEQEVSPSAQPEPTPDVREPEPSADLEVPVQPEPTPAPTPAPTPEPTPSSKYQDGTFTGTGEGYNGPVTVSVTISRDQITGITVVSHMDDEEYMGSAKTGVITSIILMQKANVSAVSGATYSSEGIMDAVAAALQQAAN